MRLPMSETINHHFGRFARLGATCPSRRCKFGRLSKSVGQLAATCLLGRRAAFARKADGSRFCSTWALICTSFERERDARVTLMRVARETAPRQPPPPPQQNYRCGNKSIERFAARWNVNFCAAADFKSICGRLSARCAIRANDNNEGHFCAAAAADSSATT